MDSAGVGEIIGLLGGIPSPTTCVPGKTRRPPVILVARLAAGSAGPRRRRCSLCVHLPRGKGGWPRPWCAWFSRARTLTKHRGDGRSRRGSTSPRTSMYVAVKLSLLSGNFSSSLAQPPIPFSARRARLILFFPPRKGAHLHMCVRDHTEAGTTIATLDSRAPLLVLRWDRYLDLSNQSSEATSVSQRRHRRVPMISLGCSVNCNFRRAFHLENDMLLTTRCSSRLIDCHISGFYLVFNRKLVTNFLWNSSMQDYMFCIFNITSILFYIHGI